MEKSAESEAVKCKVFLTGGAAEEFFAADGELKIYGDGFEIAYTLDGDGCVINCSGGEITYSRQGDAPLFMSFKEGENTSLTVGFGNEKGSVPLFTEKAEISFDNCGAEIVIRYIFCGERTVMKIKARKFPK